MARETHCSQARAASSLPRRWCCELHTEPTKGNSKKCPLGPALARRHCCSSVSSWGFCWETYGRGSPGIWREQRLVQTALGRRCFCCQTSASLPPPACSKRQRANWQQPLILAISRSLSSSPKSLPDFGARHQTVWGQCSLYVELNHPPERLSRTASYVVTSPPKLPAPASLKQWNKE